MSNTVVISGRVVRYEERQAGSKTLGSLDISVPNPSKSKDNRTYSFFKVDIWEPSAALAESLSVPKTKVLIVGRLKQETWENKEGKKQSAVKIVANEVSVLEEGAQEALEPAPEPAPAPKPAPRPAAPAQKPAQRTVAPVRRPVPPPPPPPAEEPVDEVPDEDVPF